MRYKITIQYDGGGYHGWQRQPTTPLTVQQKVEEAVSRVTETNTVVYASGRTDEGVHSLGQVAHFDSAKELPPERWVAAINHWLPEDVRVIKCVTVNDDFDARKTAKRKTYQYRMYTAPIENPLRRNREVWLKSLDVKKMDEAAKVLIGTHNFRSFMTAGSSAKSSVRTIYDASVRREGISSVFQITGNGFLYNMVRIIAEILMKIGRGELPPEELKRIMESKSRSNALGIAPSYGLYLYSVEY